MQPDVEPLVAEGQPSSGSGLAIASLVVGIMSVVLFLVPCVSPAAAVVGFVLGIAGLSSPGKGMAIAGMILSAAGFVLGGIVMVTVALLCWAPSARPEVMETSKQLKIEYDMRAIYEAAQMHYVQTASWPRSIEAMVHPRDPDTGDPLPGGLTEVPEDPWGRRYRYDVPGGRPVITCLGRDGVPGGKGRDRDLWYPEDEESY